MKEILVQLICDRLRQEANRIRVQFQESKRDVGLHYAVIDAV